MISDASNEAWRTVTHILMPLSMMPLEQVASKHSPTRDSRRRKYRQKNINDDLTHF